MASGIDKVMVLDGEDDETEPERPAVCAGGSDGESDAKASADVPPEPADSRIGRCTSVLGPIS